MSSPKPRIAILGGGPGGLTLASLLTKSSIPFTVFDLRPRPSPSDINQPSGSLDLHAEDGLLALEACGLSEGFEELIGDCTEDQIIANKHGVVVFEDTGSGSGARHRPEIARNALAHLLLSSIRPETIRWEHKVSSVQQAEDGKRWRLHFANESVPAEDFDLVVGADGAWSRARHALTDIKPVFSGKNWFTLTIPYLTTKHPNLAKVVGTGSYMAVEHAKGIVVQRGSLQSARVYLIFSSPPSASNAETWLKESGLDSMSAAELKTRLLTDPELFESWGENIKELIAVGCDADHEINARTFYELPMGKHEWVHHRGLTLVGDAAHLTLPSGEGVNAAMLDALQLSNGIVKAYNGDGDLDDAVTEYEKAMFPRALSLMEDAMRINQAIYGKDSPDSFLAFMASHGQAPEQE